MSIKAHYCVMLGAAIPIDGFPGRWDDKWLPCLEGHEDVEMRIVTGEGSEYYHCGKVLADADPYESFDHKSFGFDVGGFGRVREWLNENFGQDLQPQLMLVCYWL